MASPRLPEPFQRISDIHFYHYKDERPEIDEAQVPRRHALGEAAYNATFGQGAAMDEDKVTDYALCEFRRLARAGGHDAQTLESRQAWRG